MCAGHRVELMDPTTVLSSYQYHPMSTTFRLAFGKLTRVEGRAKPIMQVITQESGPH
jgi:hypothetical protein